MKFGNRAVMQLMKAQMAPVQLSSGKRNKKLREQRVKTKQAEERISPYREQIRDLRREMEQSALEFDDQALLMYWAKTGEKMKKRENYKKLDDMQQKYKARAQYVKSHMSKQVDLPEDMKKYKQLAKLDTEKLYHFSSSLSWKTLHQGRRGYKAYPCVDWGQRERQSVGRRN